MNAKVLTSASIALCIAAWAGCSSPPTNINLTSGGDPSTGTGEGAGPISGPSSSTATTSSVTTGTVSPVTTTTGAGGSAPASAARTFFISTVFPEFATEDHAGHKCIDCHGNPSSNGAPTYLDADPAAAYNIITQFPGFLAVPANSVLVQRGSVPHTGPAMDTQMIADVSTWLNMEVQERGLSGTSSTGTGGTPPETLDSAIQEYGMCMDFNMWQNPPQGTGLDKLSQMKTDDNIPCFSCHNNGLGGNWLSNSTTTTPPDPLMTFQKNQEFPYVLRQVTGTVDAQGNFATLAPAKRWIQKGSESCDPAVQQCHPKYTLSQSMIDGINSFVDYTLQHWMAHDCSGSGGGGGAGGGA